MRVAALAGGTLPISYRRATQAKKTFQTDTPAGLTIGWRGLLGNGRQLLQGLEAIEISKIERFPRGPYLAFLGP